MRLNNTAKLIVCCVIPLLIGFAGSFFTTTETLAGWYANLQKPSFNPPNWIFGPVWTTLYILMGISAFLVWRKGLDEKPVRTAIMTYAIQLGLNAVWTPLFFGLRSPLAGLIVIILLWSAIILTITRFRKISLSAAVLLVPYLAWVSFAAALNLFIFILNR